MKQYRGPDGQQRIWFDQAEIEHMMEDELRKAGLYPTLAEPAVNVESLLESHLGVKLDQYAQLEDRVLGVTTFTLGAKPQVEINRDLTGVVFDQEDGAVSMLGRWRATLAHEAAHVIMHRVLFEVPPSQASLFDTPREGAGRTLMRCLKRDVGFAKGMSDWREVQANKGMAALLMPRRLVAALILEALPDGRGVLPEQHSREAISLGETVSEIFQVSRQATMIRLQDVGVVVRAGQGLLGKA